MDSLCALDVSGFLPVREFFMILKCFRNLEYLRIESVEQWGGFWQVGLDAMELQHQEYIDVVVGQPGPGSHRIYAEYSFLESQLNDARILLASCRTLVVFDGIYHKIEAGQFLEIGGGGDGEDSGRWACEELEVFRCQIVGSERLTKEEEAVLDRIRNRKSGDEGEEDNGNGSPLPGGRNDDDDNDDEEVLRVLEKNGRSPPSSDGYVAYTGLLPGTMELSLTSGLDRLGTLKDLEVFGFEGVDHRIGKSELDWMTVAWPKLKVMRGLQEDTLRGIEFDKKADLREYMQQLQPDLRHETLIQRRR
ncbi:hypothetical protein BGX29_010115 [Mortierella sp. GBA35]|nr:hypothetical protein BGX29_010115 [Mortierella sp. GBA35]